MRHFASSFRSALYASALGSACLIATPAFAQVVPSVDPSQVDRRFEAPRSVAPTDRVLEAPSQNNTGVTSGAEKIKFNLKKVNVKGASVYSDAEIGALSADLEGNKISLADLQRAVNALTVMYRNDGYILSQAVLPQQKFSQSGSVVTVNVIEGFVNNVIIEGEQGQRRLVERYLKKVEGDKPLNIKDLERYLLLANDLPGISAKAVLRPASSAVGGADVLVTVEQDRWEASLGVDNRGTKFLGPVQFTGIAAVNSLADLNERTTARVITTLDTEELRFYDLQHEHQLGTEGTKLLLSFGQSDVEPGSTLSPLEIKGDSTTFAAGLSHPVIRSRATNLTLGTTFDVRNTETDVLGTRFSNDKIRALRVNAEFDTADSLGGGGVNLVDLKLSRGLDFFNATEDGAGRTRVDGEHEFTKAEVYLSRRQNLPFDGFSILTTANAQYAFDPLLSAEEFTLGGLGFGQAYDPSELSGDHGAALHIELQYGNYVGKEWLDSYQAYTYYDIGSVWQEKSSIVASAARTSLASAGVGVRMNMNETLSGNLELGLPLTREVSAQNDDDPRLFFGLTNRF